MSRGCSTRLLGPRATHACAITTSPWGPTSSWPARWTPTFGCSARIAASSSAATCGRRCTDAYVEEVTVPIDEEFVPSVDPLSGAPVDVGTGEEDAVQRIDEHHEID